MLRLILPSAALVLLSPFQTREESRDTKLANWRPKPNYEAPLGEPISSQKELAGTWRTHHLMERAVFTFKPGKNGEYQVEFKMGGCLDRWQSQRTAKMTGNKIRLNLPVENYISDPYNQLFAVRRHGRVVLLPAWAMERSRKLAKGNPKEIDSWLDHFSFRKLPPDGKTRP